jgi:pilus assembly protein Flp/PilA
MRKPLAALVSDRSGTTAIEYGLLISLLALAIVAGITASGTGITGVLSTIATDLQTATAG